MTIALWALVGVGLLEAAATWWLVRTARRLRGFDARLGQLTEAVRLLAETSEAGFKASAAEIARLAERSVPASAPTGRTAAPKAAPRPEPAPVADARSKSRTRRAVAAVRKGQSVKDAAVSGEMSEAELRLRVHLAETGAARVAATRESGRGALRA